mgnify:CR=1 FL=1
MKVCPRCHAVNDDDANFCKICGYRFPEEKTIRVPPPEPTRKALDTQLTPSQTYQHIKEKRVIRIVTIVAIIFTILLLTPLALNGVSIHYIPKGVVLLSAQKVDSVLGGNWVVTNISSDSLSYISTHILHASVNNAVSADYQYLGYKVYDIVDLYLEFPNEAMAKEFYLNYTKGVVTTTINTYPATVFQSSTAVAVMTQFGNYVIYVEAYSVDGSPIPYTPVQIIQLVKGMEVI